MILQKVIHPAAKEASVTGKVIGWHTLRHSLGTKLRFLGIDVKVAHASASVVEMLLPPGVRQNLQHSSAPPKLEKVAV